FVSWSVTFAAKTVTVHVSAGTKFVSGSSVKLVPAPFGVALCAPLVVQEMEYHEALTFTGSLKPIVMLLSTATFTAPEAGARLVTAGASSPVPVLRGLGAPMSKSAELLSVSVAPLALRSAAVVLLRAAVGEVSEQFAAPYPTTSAIEAPV